MIFYTDPNTWSFTRHAVDRFTERYGGVLNDQSLFVMVRFIRETKDKSWSYVSGNFSDPTDGAKLYCTELPGVHFLVRRVYRGGARPFTDVLITVLPIRKAKKEVSPVRMSRKEFSQVLRGRQNKRMKMARMRANGVNSSR